MNFPCKMRRLSIGLILFVHAIFLPGCGSENESDSQTPVSTTVCELIANPSHFNHKRVVFSGEARGGVEGLALFDSSCPGKGIVLNVEDAARSHPDFVNFRDALNKERMLGVSSHQLSATFQGVFSYHHFEHSPFRLTASQVSNVHIGSRDASALDLDPEPKISQTAQRISL